MGFMNAYTKHGIWLIVDCPHNGTTYLPMADLFNTFDPDGLDLEDVQQYVENTLSPDTELSAKVGWGARLSAPGYTDCTEWLAVYDNEREACEALLEIYGNQDDEEYDEDWEKELRAELDAEGGGAHVL